jgi:hypothetical protein
MRAVRRAARLTVFIAAGVAVLWLSAHITVRLPLAVPVLLIGVILLLIAAGHRRPPADLFPEQATRSARRASSSAIPMPPASETAPPVTPWAFDEPDEETW